MKTDTIRWFDKARRVGIDTAREDGCWMLVMGRVEHVLTPSSLRELLRAMRRLRDYQAGMEAARRREAKRP